MSITVETMATGARYTMNRMNDMPDWIPISMFWGFPTMLMVLPILEAMAVAIRYGIGLSLYFRQSRITSGVYISTTMSFTKNALDSAVTITTNTSNFFGVFADDAAFKENLLKNPPSVMFAVTTVSYTHLRAHETRHEIVCRLLLEKKKKTDKKIRYSSNPSEYQALSDSPSQMP